MNPENIIISRTDGIGDVVLALPMAKIIKDRLPGCRVAFLGKEYTKPVIKACSNIDQFITLNEFMRKDVLIGNRRPQAILHALPSKPIAKRAKELGIPTRIGAAGPLFHLMNCNKRVKLNPDKSNLHETQLNLRLLSPLGITEDLDLQKIGGSFGLDRIQPLGPSLSRLLDPSRYNLIFHPRVSPNRSEWGLKNFISLVEMLEPSRFKIFITGTEPERSALQPLFEQVKEKVTDLTGQMDLYQLMSFINRADGLLAADTGPLHLAAALGKDAFGIYSQQQNAGDIRWAPVGNRAKVFISPLRCKKCPKQSGNCDCLSGVLPEKVAAELKKITGGEQQA